MIPGTLEISSFAKKFFRDCADLLQNGRSCCINPITYKIEKTTEFKNLERDIWIFAVKHNEFVNKYSPEAFFLSINSGIREAVTEELKRNITQGEPLLSGISTENEIEYLFFELKCSFPDSKTIKKILDHIFQEINEIVSEYDAISMLACHKTQLDQERISKAVDNSVLKTKGLVFDLEEKVSTAIDGFEEKTKNRFKKFSAALAESEKRAHESNITILGIFSAIVLTFSTSVNFFASIINSFSGFSSYKIFLIILITGFICVGALLGLFYYLERITENKGLIKFLKDLKGDASHKKSKTSSAAVKVSKRKMSFPKSILPFTVIEVALLVLMGIVVMGWNLGWIESRNNDISQKYSSYSHSSNNSSTPTQSNLESDNSSNSFADS